MNRTDAITIRYPATANLMVDSTDRDENVYSSPWNFAIQRPNSILNGFFTRIGTSEVVLEWCFPNGNSLGDVIVDLDLSGTQTITFSSEEFYTVEGALDYLVSALNTAFSTTIFQIDQIQGSVFLATSDGSVFSISGQGSIQLGFINPGGQLPGFPVGCPDLRPYRYIDFVSSSLTYNQDLKDSTTATTARDVLCRWYFAWDDIPPLDGYGFPILMGYTQFRTRRIFNPPKQIRWDKIQPVGQLLFEVYGDDQRLVNTAGDSSEWLMTLQVSED